MVGVCFVEDIVVLYDKCGCCRLFCWWGSFFGRGCNGVVSVGGIIVV